MIEASLDASARMVFVHDLTTFHNFVWALMAIVSLRTFDRVDVFGICLSTSSDRTSRQETPVAKQGTSLEAKCPGQRRLEAYSLPTLPSSHSLP